MENLTTPKAILFGLGLIALAIASVPYSSMLVKDAQANNIQRVQICGKSLKGYESKESFDCVGIRENWGGEKNLGILFTTK